MSTSNPAPQKFSLSIVLVDNLVVKLNEENLVENLTVSSPTYYYVDLSGSEKDTLLQVGPICLPSCVNDYQPGEGQLGRLRVLPCVCPAGCLPRV